MINKSMPVEYCELVDRYKHFRKINRSLHNAFLSYLPKKGLKECAKKLGISKSGVFVFQEQHEADVLIDYCIYDYHEGGENAVSRYVMENPPTPDSDEHVVLKAMLESHYSLIQVEDIVEGVGIRAHDLLNNRRFFLVDIGFSQTAGEGVVIAARIIPFEDFVMTSGAALPVDADTLTRILDLLNQRFDGGPDKFPISSSEQKADLTASIIHFCLEADASSRIAYEDVEKEPELIPFPSTNNRIGRNDPCPCGSGKKYKRCCGR
ncbi:MAG: SEC-C metal-binding domain-containing protein [Planctomycetota bacterium]